MATEHKDPVLIFEAEEVLQILRNNSAISDSQILDAVANYARIHHREANADSTHFHESGLVLCNLKTPTKKGK